MENEKYLNHYVDIITATMSDAIIRNVSLQANLKISEEIIGELNKRVEELSVICANQNSELEELQNKTVETSDMKREFDNMKTLVNNVDIYRGQLVKERELHQQTRNDFEKIIQELRNELDILKTPPKRKRVVKVADTPVLSSLITEDKPDELVPTTELNVRDGGTF
jgi:histone H3/H4